MPSRILQATIEIGKILSEQFFCGHKATLGECNRRSNCFVFILEQRGQVIGLAEGIYVLHTASR